MRNRILALELKYEHDVVHVRQRARQFAALLAFDLQSCTRIVTAVSEIARNAYEYAGGGKVEFAVVEGPERFLEISISDSGPGIDRLGEILAGTYVSKTGLGKGIRGSQRLMERFDVETGTSGTKVVIGKPLPKNLPVIKAADAAKIMDSLGARKPGNPFEEIQAQNQELLRAMEELRLREEETAQALLELRSEREMRERFVATLSHDLRSPMTAAKLSAELILRIPEATANVRGLAGRVRDCIDRADKMTSDLLDANRIRAGQPLPLNITECRLNDIVEDEVRGLGEIHGPGRFVVTLPREETVGRWDGLVLRRMLDNLVGNAVKYGTASAPVRIDGRVANGVVSLSVTNEGAPLSSDEQASLFDPYRRSASAHAGAQKGWGLGLTLVKGMIEAHGGSVSVKSSLQEGTCFTLAFPLEANPSL